jgi:hypothetical protein
MFPQSWQLTEARFPHLLRLVKVGNVSMLQFAANFRILRGRYMKVPYFKDFIAKKEEVVIITRGSPNP